MRPTRPRLTFAAAVMALASLAGCACCGPGGGAAEAYFARCEPAYYPFEGNPCFGYYSTCWRPWPAECVPCPPPYGPVLKGELLLPAIEPMPMEPMPTEPMPAEPESAEPSPSDTRESAVPEQTLPAPATDDASFELPERRHALPARETSSRRNPRGNQFSLESR